MRSYEALIAYHPDIGEAGIKDQLERVKQIIASNGGEVTQAVEWGLRDLSYRIKKQRRAFYTILVFNGDGATVAELERNLRITEIVLRYMTTQIDPNRPPLELHRPRRDDDERDDEMGDGRDERDHRDRRRTEAVDEPSVEEAGDADAPELQ